MSRRQRGKAGAALCAVSAVIALVMAAGHVRVNQAGLELIGDAEGCRRTPYRCPAGRLTDGIGNSHGVTPGTDKTDQQIAADWQHNILAAEHCINAHFRGRAMSDNAFSAMTSAAFNMGCAALEHAYSPARRRWVETALHHAAQAGQWTTMCRHLPDFVHARGKRLPGLVARREKEQVLCLTADR